MCNQYDKGSQGESVLKTSELASLQNKPMGFGNHGNGTTKNPPKLTYRVPQLLIHHSGIGQSR